MKKPVVVSFLIFCSQFVFADHASISFENGSSGAIVTTSGTVLPKGKFVVGFSTQFLQLDDISDERLEELGDAEEEVHSVDSLLQISANLAYGLSDKFTIGLSLPYIKRSEVREAEHHMGSGEVELAGDSKGFGDLTLFGLYNFMHDETHDAALIAGIKTPTGDTSEKELEGPLFETEQQPGSGSWDPFIGAAYNRNWDKSGISGNILYTFVSEGDQQTDLGKIFNYNIAYSHRLFSAEGSHDHGHHKHGLDLIDYVDGIVELNGDVREHAKINGELEEHTGGHTLYFSPGIRIGLGHQWSVYTSIAIPIINDLNGQQSEPEYRFIGGISATF